MCQVIKIVKIERKQTEVTRRWRLVATRENGSDTCLGDTPSERGSKMMLSKRAKQFGLTVTGDTAQ